GVLVAEGAGAPGVAVPAAHRVPDLASAGPHRRAPARRVRRGRAAADRTTAVGAVRAGRRRPHRGRDLARGGSQAMTLARPRYDSIGVGIGPFNLSAAALAATLPELKTLFVERARSFAWHPGMLISGATIQTSHLKDLVTLADPTSPY